MSSNQPEFTEGAEEQPKLWTRAFIMVTLANFFMFCGFSMLPSLLPLHFRDLGAPEPLIGFVAGVYTLATLLMRPIVGVVIDRVGRKGVLGLGLVIMCLASVAYAVFPFVSLVLVIRFIQGLGWAMSNTSSPTLAADIIPQKRFAEGMGWFTQGNSIASVIAPGFALAVYYNGGAEIATIASAVFFALAFIASRLTKVPDAVAGEGDGKPKAKASFSLASMIERRSLLPAFVMFFVTLAFGSIASFVPVMTEVRELAGVVWYFPVQALAILITRPQMGKLVDRKGYRISAVVGMVGLAIGLLFVAAASNFALLMLGAVFSGVGYSTCYATFQTMAVAGIEKERRGTATATFYLGFDGGMGLGAILAGLLAGVAGYAVMFAVFALLPIVGLIIVFANSNKVKEREQQHG